MAKHQKIEEWHTCDICREQCKPVGTMPTWKLYEGDCLEVMRTLPTESVDAEVI